MCADMQVTIKATAAKDVGSVRFGDEVELKSSDGQKQLHEPPQGWIFSSKPRFAACSQLATDDKTRKWRVVDPTSAKRTSKLRVGDIVSIQNNEVSSSTRDINVTHLCVVVTIQSIQFKQPKFWCWRQICN